MGRDRRAGPGTALPLGAARRQQGPWGQERTAPGRLPDKDRPLQSRLHHRPRPRSREGSTETGAEATPPPGPARSECRRLSCPGGTGLAGTREAPIARSGACACCWCRTARLCGNKSYNKRTAAAARLQVRRAACARPLLTAWSSEQVSPALPELIAPSQAEHGNDNWR